MKETVASNARGPSRIAVTLCDVLFGLSITTAIGVLAKSTKRDLPVANWAQLLVVIWLIALSWFGYHRAREDGNRDDFKSFTDPTFLQAMVDVVILALYFFLVRYAAIEFPKGATDLEPLSLLVFVVFVLYFVWDVFEGATARAEGQIGRRLGVRGGITFGFALIMMILWLVVRSVEPNTTTDAVILCAAYFALLYAYRFAQDI
jgi:hypothetical protein